MRMALAFRHDVGWNVRHLIARTTGAPVHVALFFDPAHRGVWTDAVEAAASGVRRIKPATLMAHGQWTVVPVQVHPMDAERAWYFACAQVGKRYDLWGCVAAWWLGRVAGDGMKDRWFCSELAAEALVIAGEAFGRTRAAWWTPRRLYDATRAWGYA